MVTWDVRYIYEGFLIWIIFSTYKSHKFVIWAVQLILPHLLKSHYMLVCAYVHDTVFDTCFLIQIYRYMCACLCTSLGLFYHSLGNFWLPSLHVQILELGLKWTHPPRTELILQSRLTGSFLSNSSWSAHGITLVARVHPFVLFILCTSYFCASGWCNMLL